MDVTERELTDPCEGVLVAPARGSDTGVLVLAGSSGRVERERARILAQHGMTAASIRWFGGPGQSPGICEIPLETFTAAVDFLRLNGARRIGILGTSKGAEAALLTAVRDPRVDVVVAMSPTSRVWCNVGPGRDGAHRPYRSSWTWREQAVPFVPLDDSWTPAEADGGPVARTAYGGYEQDEVTASVDVAATVLMAGGDWQPARASVTNVGKRDLPAVVASADPWLETDDPELADMSDFVKVEARTADGGWLPLDGSGRIDAPALKSGETRTYELRVRVVKDVPKTLGGSEFDFTGAFADVYRFPDTGKEVTCAGVAHGNDTFRIQWTATSPTLEPTTAKPTPSATAPTSTPSPTDGATAAPTSPPATTSAPPAAPSDTDGQMAETGTSNATVPLAAAAGALAVLGNRHATRLARFPTA